MRDQVIRKSEAVVITSTDHAFTLKVVAIYCGGAGSVTARLRGDEGDSVWSVQAGQYLLGDFTHVRTEGTSATGLVGVQTYRWGG